MRFKIFYLFLALSVASYMNYSERIVYYPDVPDVLVSKMLKVFEDMGYEFETDNRHPDAAMKALGYAHPFIIGKKGRSELLPRSLEGRKRQR